MPYTDRKPLEISEYAFYLPSPQTRRNEMVGKLYANFPSGYAFCFYHEQSGSDRGLLDLGSRHGGIDTAVLRFLLTMPCSREQAEHGLIVMRDRSAPEGLVSTVIFDQFLELGTFRPEAGRYRVFLPGAFWTDVSGFREKQKDGKPAYLPQYVLAPLRRDPRQQLVAAG